MIFIAAFTKCVLHSIVCTPRGTRIVVKETLNTQCLEGGTEDEEIRFHFSMQVIEDLTESVKTFRRNVSAGRSAPSSYRQAQPLGRLDAQRYL